MTLKKVITLLILVLISTNVFAQAKKLDKIITKDYQVIECTISKISEKCFVKTKKLEKKIKKIYQ